MKKQENNIKKTIKGQIELKRNKYFYIQKRINRMNNDINKNINSSKPIDVTLLSNSDRTKLRSNSSFITTESDISFSNVYTKKDVDYDVIIMISSYNRLEKIKRILNQLFNEKSEYTFKVIVLNDGSDDNYYELLDKYSEIILINNEYNYGKKLYWKSINKLFDEVSKYKAHAVIQIDDDFILKENFINDLMKIFFIKKNENNKYVAIYYHKISDSFDNRWGLKNNWIDGGGLYDYYFLKYINFKIQEIPITRWEKNPELSSGVWHWLSKLINQHNLLVYQTEISYVYHDGNDDSKMNTELRQKHPIKTHLVDE